MSTYPQRVKNNLLPLSIGETLPKAFEEWSFTDVTEDYGTPTETCQLCEQESLRYQFEIRNSLTFKTLWVGSQCILRFNLSVFEDGVALSGAEAKKKLDRLIQKMHQESCVRALTKLANAERNDILSKALEYYQKNKYLSPKFAAVIVWKLNSHRIDYSPSFFKIHLNSQKHRTDLREMESWKVQELWPLLTSAQRTLAIRLGHNAPLTPPR
jgi:hypothetical protein